jgi:hypothetical protein
MNHLVRFLRWLLPSVNKYRGKVIYHLVYNELITAARYRGTITYQEIAQIYATNFI